MKTPISLFVFAWMLCLTTGTNAYAERPKKAVTDSVLLSQKTEGDYLIRKYKVSNQDDGSFTVNYQINADKLTTSHGKNDQAINELKQLIDNLQQETNAEVTAATITGYASPDGPTSLNASLAERRAQDFKAYLDRTTNFSKKYQVTLHSVAEDWEGLRQMVAQSAIPDKEEILRVIDGNRNPDAKEQALRHMPSAWAYMRQHILPPLRRVEMNLAYDNGAIVEVRSRIQRPRPEPEEIIIVERVVEDPYGYMAFDDGATGLLVEMPNYGPNYPAQPENTYARSYEQPDRFIEEDIRTLDRWSKRDARIARRLARKESREAARIARSEAKAARQLARTR